MYSSSKEDQHGLNMATTMEILSSVTASRKKEKTRCNMAQHDPTLADTRGNTQFIHVKTFFSSHSKTNIQLNKVKFLVHLSP